MCCFWASSESCYFKIGLLLMNFVGVSFISQLLPCNFISVCKFVSEAEWLSEILSLYFFYLWVFGCLFKRSVIYFILQLDMSNALSQMNLLNLAHILQHTFHSTIMHNQRETRVPSKKQIKTKAKTLVWISRTWKTIECFLTSGFHRKAIQLLKKLENSAILLAFKSYHKHKVPIIFSMQLTHEWSHDCQWQCWINVHTFLLLLDSQDFFKQESNIELHIRFKIKFHVLQQRRLPDQNRSLQT